MNNELSEVFKTWFTIEELKLIEDTCNKMYKILKEEDNASTTKED